MKVKPADYITNSAYQNINFADHIAIYLLTKHFNLVAEQVLLMIYILQPAETYYTDNSF